MILASTSFLGFGEIGRSIDRSIYKFIGSVYKLIVDLANYRIFSDDQINGFAAKIYALIGIFMLFKLTFSMISYVVNPDQVSDKARGFGSLIRNIIISLILVIAVPYIFSEAYYVQSRILEDGTLIKIIFDDETANDESSDRSDVDYGGMNPDRLSYLLYSQFVRPNKDIEEIRDNCDTLYEYKDGKRVAKDGSVIASKMNPNCSTVIQTAFQGSGCEESAGQLYIAAIEYKDFTILSNTDDIYTCQMKYKDIDGSTVKAYVIDYSFLASVITGLVVLIMLISICIDVATRTIKLAFYQMIAPIPIIANCAPGTKSDGALQKWAKACVNTYLDLFIRLFGLFLGMYIITAITDTIRFEGFATIVIVIGVLIFVKQIPKIVNDITGLKFDGFTLNPFKKIENEALGGKQLIGAGKRALGAAGGLAAGTASGILGAATGSGGLRPFTGGLSGLFAGAKGKKIGDIWASGRSANARMRDARLNGSTLGGRIGAGIATGLGVPTRSDRINSRIHEYDENIKEQQNRVKNLELQRDRAKEELAEANRQIGISTKSLSDLKKTAGEKLQEGLGVTGANYNKMKDLAETLKGQIGKNFNWSYKTLDGTEIQKNRQGNNVVTQDDIDDIMSKLRAYEQDGWKKVVDECMKDPNLNATMTTKIDVAHADAATAGRGDFTDGNSLNSLLGSLLGESSRNDAQQRAIDEQYYDDIHNINQSIAHLEEKKRSLYEQERVAKANEGAIKK